MDVADLNSSSDDCKWKIIKEIDFLKAAMTQRPLGHAKHFQMLNIMHILAENTDPSVTPEDGWNYLESWYDLKLLGKEEKTPYSDCTDGVPVPSYLSELFEKRRKQPIVEVKPVKTIKDYSRNKKLEIIKSEPEGSESDKTHSAVESDDDVPLKPDKEEKKLKNKAITSSPRVVLKRGKKPLKEVERDPSPVAPTKTEKPKKEEETPVKTPKKAEDTRPGKRSKKKEDDEPLMKKGKAAVGKRTLRSRGEDEGSNKSSSPAPPPAKRPRRI